MEIKVKKATGTPSRTTSTISLTTGLNLPEAIKTKIKNDVGDFLVESVISSVGKSQSPVAGEDWPTLSIKYKKKKAEDGLPGKANMEYEGDMLDALEYRETKDGIELGFFGEEAWKADGHLKFSGKDNGVPQRRFLPAEDQEFVPKIQREVEKIIADAIADGTEFERDDFNAVNTKSELYDVLAEYFPDATKAEILNAVTRNPALVTLLDDLGLWELL